MKSPLEMFMKLGDKVTGGDVKKKLDWDYWLMWTMFLAFVSVFVGYVISFYNKPELSSFGWSFVILAILWFQYHGLVQIYNYRKLMNQPKEKVESVDDMLKEFKNG